MTRLNAKQREGFKDLLNKLFEQVEKAEEHADWKTVDTINNELDLMDEVLTILDAQIVWTDSDLDRVKEIR